jgi:hypothetical protein
MLEAIQSYLPAEWQRTVEFVGAPLWWIPGWQGFMLGNVLNGVTTAEIVAKVVFLLPPVLVLVVGVWATMGALYTLPFRATRIRFVTTLAYTWWDVGRSMWFFWVGVIRVLLLLVGWVWGLLRLAARIVVSTLKATIESPFVVLDWTSRRYFQPGVPWIAFLLILGWSALEGTIFTYTLLPTISEVLSNITGFDPSVAVVTPILWLLLFLLIAGSFACIEGLARAVRTRQWGQIGQMLFVEFFVMFFEVVFLYRELIDAITPWVAQQTGGQIQLGLTSTLLLAGFGWVGIRGMTWFLFGRYGTPALLSILSRETISQPESAMPAQVPAQANVLGEAVDALKKEIDWFKDEGRHVAELLSLPILQLLAVALNFPIVVVRGDPMFRLPFRSLDEVVAKVSLATGERTPVARRASA